MSEGNGPGTADIENGNQGIPVVHVSIANQALQVQPVIQANQASAGNFQTIQVVRPAASKIVLSGTPALEAADVLAEQVLWAGKEVSTQAIARIAFIHLPKVSLLMGK
ncbi:cAMP responsive element-binding protein [Elysia marginata]|uniref:cAMP responsive element-binding protein n=1 Tax=Elysia marginata TaxID=1093978 RepID=A0AAV4ER84_9GAST|nr:cAMP responsive element-binding protein [Elysia marginata]